MRGVTLGRRGLVAGLLLMAVLALVAVPVVLAATKTITITSSAFPSKTTVRVGDTVRWVNSSNVMHDVTANGGAFESDYIDDGESFSYKFTKTGSYPYYCTLHSGMTGRVVVQAASSGGSGSGGSGGGGGVPAAPDTDAVDAVPETDPASGPAGGADQPDALAAILAILGAGMLAATMIIDRHGARVRGQVEPVRVRSDEREDR